MKKLSLSLLAACLFLFACKKDALEETNNPPETPTVETPPDLPLYNTLLEAGIKKENISDDGTYYVVGGDLRFKKNDVDLYKVRKYLRVGEREVLSQTIGATTVAYDFANSIIVKINSNLYNDWDFAVRQAMQHWATIADCRINFHQLRLIDDENLADIRVEADGGALNTNTFADATFPTVSGEPGWRIRINTDIYSTSPGNQTPVNQRGVNTLWNIIHEFGHTIGFLHVNENAANIPGTTNNDPNSVMRGSAAASLWTGFSAGDVTAAQFVYPVTEANEYITFPEGDFSANFTNIQVTYEGFNVTWNSSLIASSTVTLQVFHNRVLQGTVAANIANNGSYFFSESDYHTFFGYENDVFMTQIRIVSDANPSLFDDSPMFHINWE